MSNRPVLTVIIPTRNRADTLVHAVRTVMAQPNRNIEILISDNFSDPEVKQAFDSMQDERLRYIRTTEVLGMSEHYDFAVGHATGEWVAILGDDDGLIPDAVERFLAVAKANPDIKAITCANSWFRWPTDEHSDDARLTKIGSHGYEVRSSLSGISKVMSGIPTILPTIYTGGFVHADVIAKIRAASPGNKLIMCINPDLYSGMAICSVTEKYIYSYEPWMIAGNSKHSTGRKHKETKPEDLNKLAFVKESSIGYHPILQRAGNAGVGSHQLYFYDAYLQSQHLRKNDMGVTLEDQMVLAMVHANKKKLAKTSDYCKKVAEVNGADFAGIERRVKAGRPIYRVKKLSRKALKIIPGLSRLPQKNIDAEGLKNIYDASILLGRYI